MAKVVVCTICSKSKREDRRPLPARERYTGSHIKKAEEISVKEEMPFFFLSGVYGFIAAEEEIPYYDHLLDISEVAALVHKVEGQLRQHDVKAVYFYTKLKEAWIPYLKVMQKATADLGIDLHVESLHEY